LEIGARPQSFFRQCATDATDFRIQKPKTSRNGCASYLFVGIPYIISLGRRRVRCATIRRQLSITMRIVAKANDGAMTIGKIVPSARPQSRSTRIGVPWSKACTTFCPTDRIYCACLSWSSRQQ
jgi:hypothetical protein